MKENERSFILLGYLNISYLKGEEMVQRSGFLSFRVSGALFDYTQDCDNRIVVMTAILLPVLAILSDSFWTCYHF